MTLSESSDTETAQLQTRVRLHKKFIWSVQRNTAVWDELWLVLTMLIQFKICLTGLKIKLQPPFHCNPVLKLFRRALPVPCLIFWFSCEVTINSPEAGGRKCDYQVLQTVLCALASRLWASGASPPVCRRGQPWPRWTTHPSPRALLRDLLSSAEPRGEEHIKDTHSPEWFYKWI